MSEDFSIEDERNAGRDIWKLITTVLDMPESSDSPGDYWDDVMGLFAFDPSRATLVPRWRA